EQALLEGMMGLISGPIQYGVTTAPFRNTRDEQSAYDKQQSIIKKYEDFASAKVVQLQEAQDLKSRVEQSGTIDDTVLKELIEGTEFENIVVEAFAHGTTGVLESKIAEVANNEQESSENIQKANQLLETLQRMEQEFRSFQRYSDPSDVFNNRLVYNRLNALKQATDKISDDAKNNLSKRLEEINSRYPGVADISLEEFVDTKGLKGKQAVYNLYNKDEALISYRALQRQKE